MGAVGGSVESISIAGREFAVAADSDVSIKIGGYENDVASNGNATTRLLKTRVPLSVSGANLEVDHSNGDLEYLQELADSKLYHDFTITLAGGTTYQGSAQITGELAGSTATTVAAVSFMGQGKLKSQ